MGGLFLFLLIQLLVNAALRYLLAPFITSIFGVIAYYMLSSLLISFFGALLQLPRGYRRYFYKEPFFHKTMLTYFAIFLAIDLLFYFI